MILMKVFLRQSSRVIGLVLLRLPSNSFGLGMGNIVAFRQLSGILFNLNMRLNKRTMRSNILSGKCLIISYEIFEGPVALLLGNFLIICETSSTVIKAVRSDLSCRLFGVSFM